MLHPAVHSCLEAAAVEAWELACNIVGDERVVPRRDEGFGDEPNVFFRCHPVLAIQARKVHRTRVGAQCALAAQIVVVIEVAECQLARGAINGRAKAQPGEVRFGNAAPEATLAIDGDDVVVVVDGLKIHEQRRMALDAQSGRGHERSLKAMAFARAENARRRPRRVRVLVRNRVDELLDAQRCLESAQGAQVFRRQAEAVAAAAIKSVSRFSPISQQMQPQGKSLRLYIVIGCRVGFAPCTHIPSSFAFISVFRAYSEYDGTLDGPSNCRRERDHGNFQ